MPQTLRNLIDFNNNSIMEIETFKAALRARMAGLPTAQKFAVLSTISDIELRLRTLQFTQVHLAAAQTVVLFSGADEQTLMTLGQALDKQIVAGTELEAVLNDLPAVLIAAAGIDGLINGHIHS
jgi:phosphoserine phosphatase